MSSSTYAADLRASLARDGFVIVPSLLSPTKLLELRDAAARTVALARAGKWPHIRTLPKRFPPWGSDPSVGIWGVQHLLHPDLPDSSTFAAAYFSAALLKPIEALLQCTEDDLVLELFNLLTRPDEDFELRWHRDDVSADATTEEEEAVLLKGAANHTQWNLSLYDDASLIVVPGSHSRARTLGERATGPFEPNMPGKIEVKLEAGDCVLYNNNILHRGVYSKDVERMTLHGSVGQVGHGKERARNVLQHGIGEWVDRCSFESLEDGVRQRAEGMRARAVQMGRENEGVGFFSKDE
ncbi:hypothetical protein RQP46_007072 [Phenoliferia psychrophenolica]